MFRVLRCGGRAGEYDLADADGDGDGDGVVESCKRVVGATTAVDVRGLSQRRG